MKELCYDLNMTQSFSQKGCPYDSPSIELFHSIIKSGFIEILIRLLKKLKSLLLNILKACIAIKGYILL